MSSLKSKYLIEYDFNDGNGCEPHAKVMRRQNADLLSVPRDVANGYAFSGKCEQSSVGYERANIIETTAISSTISSTTRADVCSAKLYQSGAHFDHFLQEIFSWNPEWLQGRAYTKPPLKKFNEIVAQTPFKLEYSRDDYIARHIPFIHSEIFVKLSDTFKNDAPSRCKHDMFINDSANYGHSDINTKLDCYLSRDSRQHSNSVAKYGDIICLQVMVTSNPDNKVCFKHYFGIIIGHSMLEYTELEPQVMRHFRLTLDDNHNRVFDKYTVITKRSRQTSIRSCQVANMEIMMNAIVELKQAKNLLSNGSVSFKLLTNILNAQADVHQYHELAAVECDRIKTILANHVINMISKVSPMKFIKGMNNIIAVDIADEKQRLYILCDIVTKTIAANNGKLKLLIVTKNDEMADWWRDSLKPFFSRSKSSKAVKPLKLDSGRGWTRHNDIVTFVRNYSIRAVSSCVCKLSALSANHFSYETLNKRRKTYQEVISSCTHLMPYSSLTPAAIIAREELLQRGYEKLITECNIIIGTLFNVINCRQLTTDMRTKVVFDCCIIDEAQSLPDVDIFSVIHFGLKMLIIGGDSSLSAHCSNPLADEFNFNVSLFNRLVMNCAN